MEEILEKDSENVRRKTHEEIPSKIPQAINELPKKRRTQSAR